MNGRGKEIGGGVNKIVRRHDSKIAGGYKRTVIKNGQIFTVIVLESVSYPTYPYPTWRHISRIFNKESVYIANAIWQNIT